MMPLAGYADRLSVRPGETIAFKVSSRSAAPYAARLVRVVSADPNPAGPGIIEDAVAADFEGTFASRVQPVHLGSYGWIADAAALGALGGLTAAATVWPTSIGPGERCALTVQDRSGKPCLQLGIDAGGHAFAVVAGTRVEGREPLRARGWVRLWVTRAQATGEVTLGAVPLRLGQTAGQPALVSARGSGTALEPGAIVIAGTATGADPSRFNGKIERPFIADRALSPSEIEQAARGEAVAGIVASWDFAQGMSSTRIHDAGPHKLKGTLVNLPGRAMTGASWTGREMCWRHAPEQYAAIHFHDDDIYDCGWETDFTWTVPAGTRSGAYAVRLSCGDAEENIPFFVVPPRGTRSADLAVLVSTFTYTVYHNHARPEWLVDPKWKADWIAQAAAWKAYPNNPGEHRDYGLSTYNYHTDGSGIAHASWLRPMLNVRSGYITYPYPDIRASGLRHFPADTHLFAWLEAKGYSYDVITDLELDEEGYDLLRPYRVVTTGSHPEYHTARMLDALETYRDRGGRFLYLGGNGFYWKIARHPECPAAIEIRRAEGGIRAWAAEPGEYYNAFDGEYGGLWRRNGRPPQSLAGVGFTAQGNFVGSHYRRQAGASDPRAAWIFAGVADELIGGFGLSGHGAAGFELDRADKRLGTPDHALVLASSEGHEPEAPWVLVPEEQLTHITTIPGAPPRDLIKADMTFFETPADGAVFSTGSITFCGSLPPNGYDNNVSGIVGNVLDRFLDPDARFPLPPPAPPA